MRKNQKLEMSKCLSIGTGPPSTHALRSRTQPPLQLVLRLGARSTLGSSRARPGRPRQLCRPSLLLIRPRGQKSKPGWEHLSPASAPVRPPLPLQVEAALLSGRQREKEAQRRKVTCPRSHSEQDPLSRLAEGVRVPFKGLLGSGGHSQRRGPWSNSMWGQCHHPHSGDKEAEAVPQGKDLPRA